MALTHQMPVISYRISPWVCTPPLLGSTCADLHLAGAPILSCVSKGVPDIFMDCHMMVAQPEQASNFNWPLDAF